jgi:hypothetical protein
MRIPAGITTGETATKKQFSWNRLLRIVEVLDNSFEPLRRGLEERKTKSPIVGDVYRILEDGEDWVKWVAVQDHPEENALIMVPVDNWLRDGSLLGPFDIKLSDDAPWGPDVLRTRWQMAIPKDFLLTCRQTSWVEGRWLQEVVDLIECSQCCTSHPFFGNEERIRVRNSAEYALLEERLQRAEGLVYETLASWWESASP